MIERCFLVNLDPGSEVEGDKLRKINPLIDFFKNKYQEFYRPRHNLAVDERMVKKVDHYETQIYTGRNHLFTCL